MLNLEDLSIVWKTHVPADEQFFEIVFAWDNAACTHAFTIEASGFIRLVSRMPDSSVLDEAQRDSFTNLTLNRQGTMVALMGDGQPILTHKLPALPAGRVGLNLGLGVAEVTTRLLLEK